MKVTSTFNQFYVKRFRKKKGLDYTLGFSKKNEKIKAIFNPGLHKNAL